jgi:hypothetical protein
MSATVTRKNPNAVKAVYERLGKAAEKEIAIGFPKGKAKAYPDGTRVIDVAAAHVFGVGVPQRDFMAFAKEGIVKDCSPIIESLAGLEEGSGAGADALREAAGMVGAEAIKKAILDGDYTPNAPATIKAKHGSTTPLIDSALMQNSVTYVVRERTRK